MRYWFIDHFQKRSHRKWQELQNNQKKYEKIQRRAKQSKREKWVKLRIKESQGSKEESYLVKWSTNNAWQWIEEEEDDRKVPYNVTCGGLNSKKFFIKDGNLLRISKLQNWNLEVVIHDCQGPFLLAIWGADKAFRRINEPYALLLPTLPPTTLIYHVPLP